MGRSFNTLPSIIVIITIVRYISVARGTFDCHLQQKRQRIFNGQVSHSHAMQCRAHFTERSPYQQKNVLWNLHSDCYQQNSNFLWELIICHIPVSFVGKVTRRRIFLR
jgi:hypothetical protein